MRDCIYIGPTPYEEDCAQVGSDDYYARSRKEMKAFQNQILRIYPIPENLNCSLGIKEGEVVVYYDDNSRAELDYALKVEGSKKLARWDEEAIKELSDKKEVELKKGEFVNVSRLPNCDFCQMEGSDKKAEYDGKTKNGPWANMCEKHFGLNGIGLGVGRGQKLIVNPKAVA